MKKFVALTIFCLIISSCAPLASTFGTAPQAADPSPIPTQAAAQPEPAQPVQAGQRVRVPNFDQIIVIVLENRDFRDAIGSDSMPYLNSLARENVLLSNFFAVRHPSLPNYIALISGSTQEITSNCTDCFINQPNLADLIEASGRTWKTYQEDMPSPCYVGNAKPYYQKHNPFIYFDSIRLNPERCQRSVVPLTAIDTDLAASQLPNFSFIVPNICNSGHDCPRETADNWLRDMIARLQASPALSQNSLIVVTHDEADVKNTGSCCGMSKRAGGQIATVLISPQARPGYDDAAPYSHYSLLKTILTAWSLPELENTLLPGTQIIEAPWTDQALISSGLTAGAQAAPAGLPNDIPVCATGTPASGNYTLQLCMTAPSDGATLTGDVTITAILNVAAPDTVPASTRAVQRMFFYLDGAYLLSDFQSPFTFTLPTADWMDGSHRLTAEAQMRDTFISPPAGLKLNFNNGVTQPPQPAVGAAFQPATGNAPVDGRPFLVAAAGDAAGGHSNSDKVSELIASYDPNMFIYLGDVYERGSRLEFLNWYDSEGDGFGRFRAITNPTIGNHEYLTENAAGYFTYWNNVPDYYSYNVLVPDPARRVANWHFISLNSNAQRLAVDPESVQYKWLEADLAANAGACTIVYYHHPYFNTGPEGVTSEMEDVWRLLASHSVTAVLNGHDHTYQRWQPLDGEGQPSPTGITEFVIGSSGHGLQTIEAADSRVAFATDENPEGFGALFLQLNPDGLGFSYRGLDGMLLDSGVIPCIQSAPDIRPPGPPAGFTAAASSATKVDLTWQEAVDNSGVSGYAIYRDGALLAQLPGGSTAYTDATTQPRSGYSYTILAYDLNGNRSVFSDVTSVTTPDVADKQIFTPTADAYVHAENPTVNYGGSDVLRADSTPDVHSYLRFDVRGLGGRSIARAQLRIYANSAGGKGLNLFAVQDTAWDEATLLYGGAPVFGPALAASNPFKAGEWITLDVTAFISGEGLYSFGLGTPGTTSISLASRESGENAPQLLIDLN